MDIVDEAQLPEALFRLEALARRPEPSGEPLRIGGRVVCRDCGEVIPAARLAAVPHAARCVVCQEQAEG